MNKIKNILIVAIICIFILLPVSCVPSTLQSQVTQTPTITITLTITPTTTLTPTITLTTTPILTNTPTLIPLADLDLSPFLVQTGDLPAGFTGAQVGDILPAMYYLLPKADLTIYQQFAYQGNEGGGIAVLVYLSREDLLQAYQKSISILGAYAENIDGIVGEKAEYFPNSYNSSTIDLSFYDCDFLVYFHFVGTYDAVSAMNYARRLDKRLSPILCPYQKK